MTVAPTTILEDCHRNYSCTVGFASRNMWELVAVVSNSFAWSHTSSYFDFELLLVQDQTVLIHSTAKILKTGYRCDGSTHTRSHLPTVRLLVISYIYRSIFQTFFDLPPYKKLCCSYSHFGDVNRQQSNSIIHWSTAQFIRDYSHYMPPLIENCRNSREMPKPIEEFWPVVMSEAKYPGCSERLGQHL